MLKVWMAIHRVFSGFGLRSFGLMIVAIFLKSLVDLDYISQHIIELKIKLGCSIFLKLYIGFLTAVPFKEGGGGVCS